MTSIEEIDGRKLVKGSLDMYKEGHWKHDKDPRTCGTLP